nr:discoidin domain-containing protein [Lachnospiraceae bacterium]
TTQEGNVMSTSEYDILFAGDWDEITNEEYVSELVKLFYNSYPRLYARWGSGTEPKTITFRADKNYDGVAYCQGTTVCVSTAYANSHPNDIGFFSHEITHSVQQYGGKLNYDEKAWWTENMANYGGFRYFHWSNPRYVQVYEASDESLQDWGYQPYGNNKWFFAYMDAKYPTRKVNGEMVYGLIDSINKMIKENTTGSALNDDPKDKDSIFNKTVKEITGLDSIEDVRCKFVTELKEGTWAFKGFGEYEDNWITENIEGVANPTYPMLREPVHGNTSVDKLATPVTEGTNLCVGATIMDSSGCVKEEESANYLIDGNPDTKWCSTGSSIAHQEYALEGVEQWVKIDLGASKYFDTYTIYNTGTKEGYENISEWEVMVSNDGEQWTSIDYQINKGDNLMSFFVGKQKARYVFFRIYDSGQHSKTVRLYEFCLYNVNNYKDPEYKTLRFNSMGGSNVEPETVEKGQRVGQPKQPTRAEYIFNGWYEDKAGTVPYVFGELWEDKEVYAGWIKVEKPPVVTPKPTATPNTGVVNPSEEKTAPTETVVDAFAQYLAKLEKNITSGKKNKDIANATYQKLMLRVKKSGKNATTVRWNALTEADGYLVYAADSKAAIKRVAVIENRKTTSLKYSGLKKGKYYKYLVVAYKKADGQYQTVSISKKIYVPVKSKKITDIKRLQVSKSKVVLKKGKSLKLKVRQYLQRKMERPKHSDG